MTKDERKKLKSHFRTSTKDLKGDQTEWARAWRRAMRFAIDAVEGVADGKNFENDVWK